MLNLRSRAILLFVAGAMGLVLLPAAHAQTCPPIAGMNSTACGTFATMQDPWPSARERWWDISNTNEQQFDAFLGLDGSQPYSYANNAQVTVSYDARPSQPYFIGNIKATGLKPNFAYQIKLLGKSVKGTRGFGAGGDDLGNERLGYAGRWWCDSSHSSQTNFDDSHYLNFYKNAPANGNAVHNMYGYIYMGNVVTDSLGRANQNFTGKNSYHITWPDWQVGTNSGMPEDPKSPFSIAGGILDSNPTIYYGYGSVAPTASVRLFYEYEGSGRPRDNVVLPSGAYKARIVLTEETFHNGETLGGFWKSVLVADNVNFTIGAAAAPTNLTATGGNGRVVLNWSAAAGATSYTVKRSTSGGAFTAIAPGVTATTYTDSTVSNSTSYSYVVVALNAAGEGGVSNTATAMPVDSSKPSVTINTPGTAAVASLNTVAMTAIDDVGVTRVDFQLQRLSDGKYWNGSAFASGPASLSAPATGANTFGRSNSLPGAAEGRYTIYASAYDARGNSGTNRVTVSVNMAAPTVQITLPANNLITNRLDAVQVTATDNANGSGINPSRVLLYIQRGGDGKWWNGTAWVAMSSSLTMTSGGGNNYALNSSMPGDLGESGRFLIMVYAYDNSGQAGRAVASISSPLTPPTITISTPANASTSRASKIDPIVGTAFDNVGGSGLNRVVFFLQRMGDAQWWDGDSWEPTATTLTTTLGPGNAWTSNSPLPGSAALLPNGRYLIAAYAYDNARQLNRATSVFFVSR